MKNIPQKPAWKGSFLKKARSSGLLTEYAFVKEIANRHAGALCYLATPYTKICQTDSGQWCPDKSVKAMHLASRWAYVFACHHVCAVSPIVQSASMVMNIDCCEIDPLDEHFWEKWCFPLLCNSDIIIVPPILGWRESVGVWREVCIALGQNKPIYLVCQDDDAFSMNKESTL